MTLHLHLGLTLYQSRVIGVKILENQTLVTQSVIYNFYKKIFDLDAFIADGNDCEFGDTVYVTDTVGIGIDGYYEDYARHGVGAAGELYYNEDRTVKIEFSADDNGLANYSFCEESFITLINASIAQI